MPMPVVLDRDQRHSRDLRRKNFDPDHFNPGQNDNGHRNPPPKFHGPEHQFKKVFKTIQKTIKKIERQLDPNRKDQPAIPGERFEVKA